MYTCILYWVQLNEYANKHVYNFNKNMKNAWYTVLIINCKKNIHIYIPVCIYNI